jgi:hypothetical protein
VTARRVLLLLVVVLLGLAGCGTQGLVLEQPTQLQQLRPAEFSSTAVPTRISWTGDALHAGERYFVIIDQLPMPPGSTIRSMTDDVCRNTPGCPDPTYLAQHQMYTTRGRTVKVESLPLGGPFPVKDLAGLHAATIVIVDRAGRRVGEEFWSTSFYAPTS